MPAQARTLQARMRHPYRTRSTANSGRAARCRAALARRSVVLLRKHRAVLLEELVEQCLLAAVALVTVRIPVRLGRRCRSDFASPVPSSARGTMRFFNSPGGPSACLNVSFMDQVLAEHRMLNVCEGSTGENRNVAPETQRSIESALWPAEAGSICPQPERHQIQNVAKISGQFR